MPRRSARIAAINPRRSARLAAAKRQQQQRLPSQPTKRMKSSRPSLNARLAGLNEYLASTPIDEDGPGFLFICDIDNLRAFVDMANTQPVTGAPEWMQTLPPNITTNTFTDDFVGVLARVSGGRCGRVLLASNNQSEFGNVAGWLFVLQEGNFMQHVAQLAFNNVHRLLATTYSLTTTKAQECTQNNLLPLMGGGCLTLHMHFL
ncbi:hypothetical protein V7S43_012009 [Phytophthora oleae]|uniref:Uncharacterized protein n=1 Tax=Phytophthora oleae TaxID=2107226 RepID=A0ABD3FC51_9STRA